MKLEVLVGMVGSGKSTYARRRADEGAIIVCHDDLTQMLHGGAYRYEQDLKEYYRWSQEVLARVWLDAGRDVLIDRNHLTREARRRWVEFCRWPSFAEWSLPTVVAVVFPFDTPEVHARRCFTSHPERGRPYEEWAAVAEHHHTQWVAEPIADDEGFDKIVYVDEIGI